MYLSRGDSYSNPASTSACAGATTTKSPTPSADRSAGEATQMTPAVEGTDHVDSDRSMCGSDNGRSSRSGKGKARVSKVTRRHPTEAVTSDKAPGESTELAKRLKAMLEEVRN